MREQGIIIRVLKGKIVEVALKKSSACGKCGICREIGQDEMMGVEAVDDVGAKIGDLVEIELPAGVVVKGSLVVFLLPVFFLAAGYLLGYKLAGETAGVVSSFVFLFCSFLVVKWYDQNIQRKEAFRARIVRKISL